MLSLQIYHSIDKWQCDNIYKTKNNMQVRLLASTLQHTVLANNWQGNMDLVFVKQSVTTNFLMCDISSLTGSYVICVCIFLLFRWAGDLQGFLKDNFWMDFRIRFFWKVTFSLLQEATTKLISKQQVHYVIWTVTDEKWELCWKVSKRNKQKSNFHYNSPGTQIIEF